MTVLQIKTIEDCLDGSFIRDFELSDPIDERFVRYLGSFGQLQYFPDFARPFFIVNGCQTGKIKGICGNTVIRVVLSGADKSVIQVKLKLLIENYKQ